MKPIDGKRMIDADEMIKMLENIDMYKEDKVGKLGVLKSILIVQEMASAQQKQILCKYCKHSSPNGGYGCRSYHYKRYETHDMHPDDFCSRAEKRE